MNPKFYHKIPADFLSDKAILILIVVLCSTLSFLLGYFAGKARQQEDRPFLSTTGERTSPPEPGTTVPAGTDLVPTPDSGSAAVKEADAFRPAVPEPAVEVVEEKEKHAAGPSETAVTKEKSRHYYTIQVGAFRNKAQAETVRKKLKKKGYTARVVSAAGKNRTLYRVWVGRFETRKGAETGAIKLTRSEGLKTLVLRTDRW